MCSTTKAKRRSMFGAQLCDLATVKDLICCSGFFFANSMNTMITYYRSLLPDEVIKSTQDVHRKLYNLSA